MGRIAFVLFFRSLFGNANMVKRPYGAKSNEQAGFGLLEVLVMIAVSASIMLVWNRMQVARQIEEVNANAAQHAMIIQAGANKLINDNRLLYVTNATPAIAGIADPFAPTMTEMQATPSASMPYVPPGYDVANRLGMSYSITISRLPTGCTPGVSCTDVTAVITSTAALVDQATGLADGARVANLATKVGLDAASSKVGSGSVLSGPAGTWTVANPLGNVPGILVIRAGYGSVSYNNLDFLLPRDGSRPMTGNLAMGGNAINSVSTISATGNILTTAGNITTNTGDIIALDGKVKADYIDTTVQSLGAACTDSGAIAAGPNGVVMVCRGGVWRVHTGIVAAAGAACSPNGSLATNGATEEALICRGGIYISLANAVSKYVEISRQAVIDGSVVTQPLCELGGVPTFRFGMVQTAVDVTTAPPKQVTLLSASAGAGTWTVSYKLKDDMGTLTSANVNNLQAVMYLECKYP